MYLKFSADFSLVEWMVSHSIDLIENIRPPQASELLLQLGLDHFLSEPEKCTLTNDKYGAVDLNGWNNGIFFLHIILFSIKVYLYWKYKDVGEKPQKGKSRMPSNAFIL